ncbi:MAG: Dyp-type peroxidase, partial [Pseudomonadales bacterium]|nr:Dyp-type peroxidase [Pseudomonadales bacterium]
MQQGILAPVPAVSRYLFLSLPVDAEWEPLRDTLESIVDGNSIVAGFGKSLVDLAAGRIRALREAPVYAHGGIAIAAQPWALLLWLRGDDQGDLVNLTLQIQSALDGLAEIGEIIDGFRYRDSRDLSGYIDGTENPDGEDALAAAFDEAGNSFLAVQRWEHDLTWFHALDEAQQDEVFGRHKATNEEFDAPDSAHVKRAAQEDFSPEAFMLRRSMPWADPSGEGLVFVSFGNSFYAFDAVMRR